MNRDAPPADRAPVAEAPDWGVSRRDAWILQQQARYALSRVLPALASAGIEAVAVKGIVLAGELYAGLEERPISDVDLRIIPADLRGAERVARREGWPTWRNSNQLGSRAMVVEGTLVELETSIGPPGLCAMTVGELIARSRKTTGKMGFEHREPELHDHVLVLCVNCFKDKLVDTTPWAIEDLLRVVALPGFDPDILWARASHARLSMMTWIVADWLATAHGSESWREVRDRIRGRRAGRGPYARLFRALVARNPWSFPLALLTRAGSDDPFLCCKALAAGGLGTAIHWASRASAGR